MRGALVLVLILAGGVAASASDLSRSARFAALNGEAETLETASRSLKGGLVITGEKLTLENGAFTATVQKVSHQYFVMSTVGARGKMPLDAAFFANAISAAVNNVLDSSTITMARFDNARDHDGGNIAGLTLHDVQMMHSAKALTGSLKALVRVEFKARSAFDPATRKMTVTVDSVKAAGLPVPLGIAFFAMDKFMKYPFVKLENPRVIVDLKPFLPAP